ncbi:hypothetical protein GCM10029992_02440 [Glycomyces albus]
MDRTEVVAAPAAGAPGDHEFAGGRWADVLGEVALPVWRSIQGSAAAVTKVVTATGEGCRR